MKIYEVKWFKDFECLCGSCPQSCCRGWVIPLSDRDCERFRRERGKLGIALFFATGGWIRAKFNANSGNCIFHQTDGLCRLQREKGHEFIPWTCQSYPRFYRNYEDFEEACLDLSCIGAARLFIENEGSLKTICREGDPETRSCTTNDDRDFLQQLIRTRSEMIGMLNDGIANGQADILFLYAIRCQDFYAKGENAGEQELSFERFATGISKTDRGSFAFPLPVSAIKGFISSPLSHPRLRRVDPNLYRMFKTTGAFLARIEKSGEDLREKASAFLGKYPFVENILARYLAYYLYQYYLRIYETYSFRRQVGLGICHVNMVLVMIMALGEKEDVTKEMLARTIAAYNRRAFFNDDIQDEMYRIFENYYAIINK